MRFLLVAIPLLIVTSCNSEKKGKNKRNKEVVTDGISRVYYKGGQLRAEVPMKGGKKNGVALEYYQSGNKHLEITYKDSKNHGVTTRYYDAPDALYEVTTFKDGKMHGIRKKYRRDGKVSSEVTYNQDEPCADLREYLVDGKLKKNYPTIIVQPVDRILKEGKYILRLSLSDQNRRVTFYEGKLEGNCMTDRLEEISVSEPGIGEMIWIVPPGMFLMEEVNIVAKVRTLQGNYYVTQLKYNLATENR